MVERLLPHIRTGGTVLDPAGGDGVFVSELLKQGVEPQSIHAYDIEPEQVEKLSLLTPNACQADFLETYAIQPTLFDAGPPLFNAIIGNPPYNCHESDYVRQNKAALKRRFGDVGVLNTYSMFLYAAINALEKNGTLCLIVMDSFLTNTYHAPLRRFILDNCRIVELLLAPSKLFNSEKADVRTVIVILKKLYGLEHVQERLDNKMRLVDRLQNEDEYWNPPKVDMVAQKLYETTPENAFLIGIPDDVLQLFTRIPTKLGKCVPGGAGISTGNDSKYLVKRSNLNGCNDRVPFFKNCAGSPYLFEPEDYIEKDCTRYAESIPNFMVRNRHLYFREGVACSSIGIRFCACYLPSKALFGVNACFFPDSELERYYLLGFLNSKLALYLIRAVLNRTNMVTPGYVKKLPYIPPPSDIHSEIAAITRSIVECLKESPDYDFNREQEMIDELVFKLYGIPEETRAVINLFSSDIMRRI